MYKLLIVDDEPLVRRGIKTLVDFSSLGIDEVFEAGNGEEGLEIFKKNNIDMVLCDINMPRLNGLALAEKIMEISPKTKVAIVTGYDYFDYAKQGIKIGVMDYILKPVAKEDIVHALKKMIGVIEKDNDSLEITTTVTELIGELAPTEENTIKEDISRIIEENISNHDFSLTTLAKELGYSSGYLSTMFKRIYGIPFQEHMLNQRLSRAKILLLSSELKNYEIAEAVGIDDVNYFSVRFKKAYGLSPKQYKQKVRDNR